MCKKHKKKIHLRQICGFHLNLFMRLHFLPRPPCFIQTTMCAKIDVPIEWVLIFPISRQRQRVTLRPRPFFIGFVARKLRLGGKGSFLVLLDPSGSRKSYLS